VDVCGYRRYSILARFEGTPDATFKVEINNNNLLVQQEFLQLNSSGWLNFFKNIPSSAKDWRRHLPSTAKLKIEMTLYAGL